MEIITEKHKNFFKENGYLVVENIIEDKKCDDYLNHCLEYAKKIGNENLTEMLQIHKHVPETFDLMRNKNVVYVIEQILDVESFGLQSVLSLKKAGTPSGKHAWNPHQDNTYIKAASDKYVSGDIVLDDHLPDSGCLYVYPGSHMEKILPFEPNLSFGNKENINPGNKVIKIPEKYKKTTLHLKKGSLLMFHSHLIHGSYANTSKNNWRPLLLMAFIRKGAKFYEGKNANRIPIKLR